MSKRKQLEIEFWRATQRGDLRAAMSALCELLFLEKPAKPTSLSN